MPKHRNHDTTELDRKVREQLIRRYARLRPDNGDPIFCTPAKTGSQHSKGKIIFDTPEKARAFDGEVKRLCGDKTPTYVYECDRSRNGHVHLTTERQHQ